MLEGFSHNREFDFVRFEGLLLATGRPPHEWDIYILKELIDNALDADDAEWHEDPSKPPHIIVRIEYINVPTRDSRQLFVSVSNRAAFPVANLKEIFATRRYTSNKAFFKHLTRGSLGNALKTLLGIPYALRQQVASDWSPDLNPLALYCEGKKYLPRYLIDSTRQIIEFSCSTEAAKKGSGTEISIGIDHFGQQFSRKLAELKHLAEQYHLCNPHAHFRWSVEIDEEKQEIMYPADHRWANKFQGLAPVQWYSEAAFQDLLGALYRRQRSETGNDALSLPNVMRNFSGYASTDSSELDHARSIVRDFGKTELAESDLEGPLVARLYKVLRQYSPRFETVNLGAIGKTHIDAAMARMLRCTSPIFYDQITDDGGDPSTPFVIEAAIVNVEEGRRQILTAINYTPTYADPFLNQWLTAPNRDDEPVQGLRGLLNAYEMTEDSATAIFIHLICPNIEHIDFSKTQIDHWPFRKALGLLVDRLVTSFRQTGEEEELRIERAVDAALEEILREIGEDERFVFDQLLEKLYSRLSRIEELANWLATPQALSRLKTHVNNYQSRTTVLTHRVARPAAGTVSVPHHPDQHLSVPAEYLSSDLLKNHHVNKLLYVQVQEIEPVVVDNGWLCRMDMALVHNPTGREGLRQTILQCAASKRPIAVLHDADKAGSSLAAEMQGWLKDAQLNPALIVDLGLETHARDTGHRLTRLVQMMPNELARWLAQRFESLGVECKSLPPVPDVRRHISEAFEKLLLGHVWEGVSQKFEVTRLIGKLDSDLQFAAAMRNEALDRAVRKDLFEITPKDSYSAVLDRVVRTFFDTFMREHAEKIDEIVLTHLARASGKPGR